MRKCELLDKAKAMLESLDGQRFEFLPHTITTLQMWGEDTFTSLGEIFISCSTGDVLLLSKNEYTRVQEGYDIDPLAHFSTSEVGNILNIFENQLKLA